MRRHMPRKRDSAQAMAKDLESLLGRRFSGFRTILELRKGITAIPEVPGVYLVVQPISFRVKFLSKSPAGWFKAKDPTVGRDQLQKKRVDGVQVLYI